MDGLTNKRKATWLPLLRSGGEADLGAALVRLAKMAAATHQVEAELWSERDVVGGDESDDVRGLQGGSQSCVGDADMAGPFRKEVGR